MSNISGSSSPSSRSSNYEKNDKRLSETIKQLKASGVIKAVAIVN